MSVADLLSSLSVGKRYMDIFVNTLTTNSANFNGGALSGVGSINGQVLPSPFILDLNPVNIIYRPGGPLTNGSNIVNTWASVLSKANQINVNQILNIYFDDSVVSPCPITISQDFLGRANFLSSKSTDGVLTQVQINDGVIISNLLSVNGEIQINCQSLTLPNLEFSNNGTFSVINSAVISGSADATVASIQMNALSLFIALGPYGSINLGSLQTSFISLGNTSVLEINLLVDSSVQANLVSGDNTSSLIYSYDSSSYSTFSNSGFAGTANYVALDNAIGTSYNDLLQVPAWSTSNVQSSLDYVKANYLPQTSSSLVSTGNLGINVAASSTQALQVQGTGTIDMGRELASFGSSTNTQLIQLSDEDTVGQAGPSISLNSSNGFPSIIYTNNNNLRLVPNVTQITQGIYDFGLNLNTNTSGILTSSVLSSGSMSCGTNSMTCGSLLASSSVDINSSQAIHGVLYGSFTDSSVIAPSTALEGQTHAVSSVQASPQSVLMSITTPNGGGTGFWDFVIVSQNGNATSYNSGTKVLTLGYNLVNVCTTSATSSPVAINYMIIY